MFTVILEWNFDLNRFPGEMVGNGNKFILVVGDRRRNTSKTSCVVSFPEDRNSPLKILVVDSVSEDPDSVVVLLCCQIDSGRGFTVFPFKKSQKHGLR